MIEDMRPGSASRGLTDFAAVTQDAQPHPMPTWGQTNVCRFQIYHIRLGFTPFVKGGLLQSRSDRRLDTKQVEMIKMERGPVPINYLGSLKVGSSMI